MQVARNEFEMILVYSIYNCSSDYLGYLDKRADIILGFASLCVAVCCSKLQVAQLAAVSIFVVRCDSQTIHYLADDGHCLVYAWMMYAASSAV